MHAECYKWAQRLQNHNLQNVGQERGCGVREPDHAILANLLLFQQCGASLLAQLVRNPPAMWETWVLFLGWEDTPGKGTGYPLQCSVLENSVNCLDVGVPKSQTWLSNFHFHYSVGFATSPPAFHLLVLANLRRLYHCCLDSDGQSVMGRVAFATKEKLLC